MNWNHRPFLLKPAGKDYIWGGNRLNDDFSKGIALKPLAETWECSTHPDGPSTVASGEYEGMLLKDVLLSHPEFLGSHPKTCGELPILIKFIDAKKDLSIQVHPDDAYAATYENGQRGKNEMWYVLDAAPGSKLVCGFNRDLSLEDLKEGLKRGDVEKYVQHVSVKKDDVFYIEAGTVHAIGAGVLVVEIQENSNLTYRLYDYNRTDKNGCKRELHIKKALDVAKRTSSAKPKQPLRVLRYKPGCATELLCRCKSFQAERMLINTERCRDLVPFATDSGSFQVLLCTKGCGVILFGENESLHFFQGDCIFIPADSVAMKIHGSAQLLKVIC